jgi:hypothetical protein
MPDVDLVEREEPLPVVEHRLDHRVLGHVRVGGPGSRRAEQAARRVRRMADEHPGWAECGP